MIEALLVAVPVSAILVEVLYRAVSSSRIKSALTSVQSGFAQFCKAATDEERQHFLLATGGKTLVLSILFLAACAVIGVIAFAPLQLFAWDESEEIVYLSVLAVLSALWFCGRAMLGRK